jgi:hypothetical protein
MAAVATWEDRMAFRASVRKQAAEVARRRDEAADRAVLIAASPALAGENDWVIEDAPHRGHYTHTHPWHGNGIICSCGERAGCFSFIPGPAPEPEPCPVCIARGIPLDGR